MLQVIQKKLRSQKLLNACLFFGIMILVAVLSLIPMFEKGATLKVYSDDAQLNGSVKTVKQNKKQTLKVVIPKNGGLVIEL